MVYTCKKCNQEKLETEMAKDRSRPSGRKDYCKKCESSRISNLQKNSRQKSKEIVKKLDLESRLKKLETALEKLLRNSKVI